MDIVDGVEIEYVPEVSADMAPEFAEVFARFQLPTAADDAAADAMDVDAQHVNGDSKDDGDAASHHGSDAEAGENGEQPISKRKLKKMARLSVAELKQLVKKPEVVDWVDVTAADPKLLVVLKSVRNTVPVPLHWSQKRKYLQNKRGIEKPPFELPDFIKATGIQDMRNAVGEKDDGTRLKQKTRERMQPKMGKLTIDYAKLHDAFFRWQTKPKLTRFGEMYFEGKEYETKNKSVRPGAPLSAELRAALSMPPLAPPPWLVNMQRFGPPPSYPGLKIPGLNAPIPLGAQWGFHPGGWGKPPVDEYGRPLYGDVMGGMYDANYVNPYMTPVQKELWGELEEDEEEEEEEEEEGANENGEDNDEDASADATHESDGTASVQMLDEFSTGMVTPSGMTSVATTAAGMETPDVIELRKTDKEKSLYTVIPQKAAPLSGFMGSQHVYDLNDTKKRKADVEVAVALDPSEIDHLDESQLQKRYSDTVLQLEKNSNEPGTASHRASAALASARHEDLSDMVSEHASKQQAKKRKTDSSKKKFF
ncbi:hypothetical protein RI367_004961 [Sorochytrium milnesiophthora]